MNELLGRGSAVEGALIAVLENDHATALDARVVGVHRGGDKVGEGDVGDEASALVDLEPGLFAVWPLGDAELAAQHAGVDAHVWDGLSQGEGATPGLAGLIRFCWTGLGRSS